MTEFDTPVKLKPCPICAKPPLETFKPFCSKRCADVDLNKWLTGRYAIPVNDEDDEAERIETDEPNEH